MDAKSSIKATRKAAVHFGGATQWRIIKILTVFGLAMPFGATLAQQEDASAATEGVIEEILITADRRVESVQDIPLSVTVLSAQALEEKQVRNVRDLQPFVPNLSLSANTSTASGSRMFLRGIGEDESRLTADPAIATYLDGIYLGRQTGALMNLVDIERIEVLRGPQGTQYGRNATGGALRIISRTPGDHDNFRVQLTAGNYGRQDIKVNAEKAGENGGFSIAALQRQRDGLFEVTQTGEEIGDWNLDAFRFAFTQETGDTKLLFAYDFSNDRSDPVPNSIPEAEDADQDVFTVEPAPTRIGPTTTLAAYCAANSSRQGCSDTSSSVVKQEGLTISLSQKFDRHTFNTLIGRRSLRDDLNTTFGETNRYIQRTDQDQLTIELTMASDYDGALNWQGGLYHYQEDAAFDEYTFVFPFIMSVDTRAAALFGQLAYEPSDRFGVRLGVRATEEKKDFSGRGTALTLPFVGGSSTPKQDSASWDHVNYKLAADFMLADDVMLYGYLGTGFKSGGWSPDCFTFITNPACFRRVEEETVSALEIGVKSDLLDGKLRLNAAYFFNDYEDLQFSGTVSGLGFTRINAPGVETSGFEFELAWLPTPNIELFALMATLDGEYTDVDCSLAVIVLGTGSGGTNCSVATNGTPVTTAEIARTKAKQLKNAPESSFTLGANFEYSLADGARMFLNLSAAHEDESFNLIANPENVKREATTLVDMRIGYEASDRRWSAALWGKNLGDEVYYPAAVKGGGDQIGTVYAGDPLTAGIDFIYHIDF